MNLLLGKKNFYLDQPGIWQKLIQQLREKKWRDIVSGQRDHKKKRKLPPKKQTNPTGVNKKLLKASKKQKEEDRYIYEQKNNSEEEASTDEEKAKKSGYKYKVITDKKQVSFGPQCEQDLPKCTFYNVKKDRSNSLPVSNQSVLAYKQLLTHKKQKQVIHLPAFDVKDLDVDDFLRAGMQMHKKLPQYNEFISFKDIQKLNKSQLLRLKEQNAKFKGLNTSDIQGGAGVMGVLQRKINQVTKEKFNQKLLMQTKLDHNRYVYDTVNQKMQQNYSDGKNFQIQKAQEIFENKNTDITSKTMRSTISEQKKKKPLKNFKKRGNSAILLSPDNNNTNIFLGGLTNKDQSLLQDPHIQDLKSEYNFHDRSTYGLNSENSPMQKQQQDITQAEHPGWWYYMGEQNQENKTSSRDSAGFVFSNQTAYLYGGISNHVHGNIEKLDINKNYKLIKWDSLTLSQNERGTSPNFCYGHSLNLYNENTLVLFGGQRKFDMFIPKHKQLRNEVWTLDLNEKIWQERQTFGFQVSERQHHASTILGKYLIVHGGSDQRDRCLRDMYYLNLEKFKWKQVRATGTVPELSSHQCCTVIHSLRQKQQFGFKPLMDLKINPLYDIVYEGLYFFGGFNNNNEINGKLRIVELQRQPVEFIEPETQGSPPQPRHSHSMVFNDKANVLVIHGGQRDVLRKSFLSDTYLLFLNNMNWVKISDFGQTPQARSRHVMGCFDSKIYIFGGLNQKGFLDNNVQILEIDKEISVQQFQNHNHIQQSFKALQEIHMQKREYKNLKEQRIQELFMKDQEQSLIEQMYLNFIPQKEEFMRQMYQELAYMRQQEERNQTVQQQEKHNKTYMQTSVQYIQKSQENSYKKQLAQTARYDPKKWVGLLDQKQNLDTQQYSNTISLFPHIDSQQNSNNNNDLSVQQPPISNFDYLSQQHKDILHAQKLHNNNNLKHQQISDKKNDLVRDLQSINHIMYNAKNTKATIMAKIQEITKNTTIVTDIKKQKETNFQRVNVQSQKVNELKRMQQIEKEKKQKIADGDLMKRRMEKRFRMMPIKQARANSVY